MKILILTFFLTLSIPAFAQERIALELLIDDSGVLLDAQEANQYKLMLLAHLKALATKRDSANTRIEVISTSLGRTVWSGTPLSLRRDPARAKELVAAVAADPARCNALPGAFRELQSNLAQLEREGVEAVQIIVFSSLIHTPRPCADVTEITLPQLPPTDGDIPGAFAASTHISSVSFFWVSPHQKFVWEGFLEGAFTSLRQNGARVRFLDVERSKEALRTAPFTLGETP